MSTETPAKPGISDFDFLIGSWKVHHRRLKSRLAWCTEWIESEGTCQARRVMGGQANIDDNVIEGSMGAYRACSFRMFDPMSGQWSIWWFDSRFPAQLGPPVVGQFESGEGTFYSDETLENRPIRVRFTWYARKPESPRWEQAFSIDGGVTWETNWTMQFTRDPT